MMTTPPDVNDLQARAGWAMSLRWWQVIGDTKLKYPPQIEKFDFPDEYGAFLRGVVTGPQKWTATICRALSLFVFALIVMAVIPLAWFRSSPGIAPVLYFGLAWLLLMVWMFTARIVIFRSGGWKEEWGKEARRRARERYVKAREEEMAEKELPR